MHITRYSALSITAGLLLLFSLLLVESRENLTFKKAQPDLQKVIREHPDGWVFVPSILLDPQTHKTLKSYYDLVVAQAYQRVDEKAVVMMVMTWSANGDRRAAHQQEGCYRASGCTVSTPNYVTVTTKVGNQKVVAFTARRGIRDVEDVMYWKISGGIADNDTTTDKNKLLRLMRLVKRVPGDIPDNVMVRVSTVRSTPNQPATAHIEYIREFLETLPASDRKLVMGSQD